MKAYFMMKVTIKILLLVSFLFLPVKSFAQGSGSSSPTKSGTARRDKNNFAVTRSVSGVVISMKNGAVVVKSKNGKNVSLRVSAKTRVGGGCLQAGQNVRIVYTPGDGVATLVRCNKG